MDESLSRSDQVKFWIGVLALTVYPLVGMCCAALLLRSSPTLAGGLAVLFGTPMLLTVVSARLVRITAITTVTLALLSPIATFILGLFVLWLALPNDFEI